jgi:hypothetical protein
MKKTTEKSMHKIVLSLTCLISISLNANTNTHEFDIPAVYVDEPNLPALSRSITIRSSPVSVMVSILNRHGEDRVLDTTNFTLKKEDYKIIISANGYKEQSISLENNTSRHYSIILEKIDEKAPQIITRDNIMYQDHPFRKKYTWNEANNYCNELRLKNYNDWRLPTIKELRNLMSMETRKTLDYSLEFEKWFVENYNSLKKNSRGHSYFIDSEFIENMPPFSPWFWTSEKKSLINDIFYKNEPDNFFWIVTFDYGYDAWSNRVHFVRCVREQTH